MPIGAGEGQFDAIVRLLDLLVGGTGGTGRRMLANIADDVTVAGGALQVLMPSGSCSQFFLYNRDPSDTIHVAGLEADADATAQPVEPGQTILVPAGFDDTVGVWVFTAGVTSPFTVTPIG